MPGTDRDSKVSAWDRVVLLTRIYKNNLAPTKRASIDRNDDSFPGPPPTGIPVVKKHQYFHIGFTIVF